MNKHLTLPSIIVVGLILLLSGRVFAGGLIGQGETGSSVDSQLAQLEGFQLKNYDGTYVTIYEGTGDIEMVGEAGKMFAADILGTMPPDGTYVGYSLSASRVKMKVKIVWGGTTYYTTAQELTQSTNVPWQFSTDPATYDYVMFNFTQTSSISGSFIKPLVVSGSTDRNIVFVTERTGIVDLEFNNSSSITDVTYANEGSISNTILTDIPAKKIRFFLVATKSGSQDRSNAVTLFYNAAGEFIGGSCGDAGDWAINARELAEGSIANIGGGGESGDLTLTFNDGDRRGTFTITGSYACGTGTYSGLAITTTGTPSGYEGDGFTLTTSGTVTCTTIQ